jgi:vacuolar-type H+-ATPase subunit H
VSREAASLLRDLNVQLKVAAEKAVEQTVTGFAGDLSQKTLKKIEEAQSSNARDLRATWVREFEKELSGVSQGVLSKLSEAGETYHKEISQKITAQVTEANGRLG